MRRRKYSNDPIDQLYINTVVVSIAPGVKALLPISSSLSVNKHDFKHARFRNSTLLLLFVVYTMYDTK